MTVMGAGQKTAPTISVDTNVILSCHFDCAGEMWDSMLDILSRAANLTTNARAENYFR